MAHCVRQVLFRAGQRGIATYRIPALTVTAAGSLLAFCEARRNGASDSGDISIVMRRSTDGGDTWSAPQVVWEDPGNTCGNPCAVVDRDTEEIFLLMTWNLGVDRESGIIAQTSRDTRRVFITSSRDDGCTWGGAEEMTAALKKPDWTWYATGPGAGIQMERGRFAGRLVVPCDHIEAETGRYYSHVCISEDHGRTWKLGGRTPEDQVNECEVVELEGERLMLNMRNYDRSQRTRKVSISEDGGLTWGALSADETLIEPICQASIRRLRWGSQDRGEILFSNPAAVEARRNLTVRLSRDDGRTWAVGRTLHAGPAAYSCLAALPDGRAACFYECGEESPIEQLVLARFGAEWIEG